MNNNEINFYVEKFPVLSQTFVVDQVAQAANKGMLVTVYADEIDHELIKNSKISSVQNVRIINSLPAKKVIPSKKLIYLLKVIFFFFSKGKFQLGFNFLQSMFTTRRAEVLNICSFVVRNDSQIKTGSYVAHFGNIAAKLNLRFLYHKQKLPIFSIFHGVEISSYEYLDFWIPLYRLLNKNPGSILPISQRWKQKLCAIGIEKAKIQVIHMGISVANTFKPNQINGKAKILYTGRLTEKKGVLTLIRAISKVSCQNLSLTIIGDGPLKDKANFLIESLHLRDKVSLVGAKKHNESINALNETDIFILPSCTAPNGDQEGIPVSLMEAMASSKLTISTYHSGIPELITNLESGLLVPENDVESLASTIDFAISNYDLTTSIRENGFKTVRKRFDKEKLFKELLAVVNTNNFAN